jgi:hypothetical protein
MRVLSALIASFLIIFSVCASLYVWSSLGQSGLEKLILLAPVLAFEIAKYVCPLYAIYQWNRSRVLSIFNGSASIIVILISVSVMFFAMDNKVDQRIKDEKNQQEISNLERQKNHTEAVVTKDLIATAELFRAKGYLTKSVEILKPLTTTLQPLTTKQDLVITLGTTGLQPNENDFGYNPILPGFKDYNPVVISVVLVVISVFIDVLGILCLLNIVNFSDRQKSRDLAPKSTTQKIEKSVQFPAIDESLNAIHSDILSGETKPQAKAIGKEYGKQHSEVSALLSTMSDRDELTKDVRNNGTFYSLKVEPITKLI